MPNPLSADSQILTFKNLNPAMRYSFRGTVIRKGTVYGANHPGRRTYCNLEGADAFTDAHTAGCITKDTPLPEFFSARANVTFPAVNFAPGEAVFQSGLNTQGDMVGYDDIQPGADGTFAVVVRGWCGVVTNRYLNMGTDAAVSASVTITNGFDLIGYGLAAVQLVEYGSDELALILAPTHPLAGREEVSVRELGVEAFVAHNVRSPYRERVVETFTKHKTPLNIVIELPTLESIKRTVATGIGVALMPKLAARTELERGEVVAVTVREMKLERKLHLIYRKGAKLSHAAKAFLGCAREVAKSSPHRASAIGR